MGIDAPNLQGANLRQVAVLGEQAALMQATRRDATDFQARLGSAMVEKVIRSRDQASGASDLVVHKQEDQAEFSAGDSMNGGAGGGPATGQEEGREPDQGAPSHPDSAPGLESLPDPFAIVERFGIELRKLGRDAPPLVFRDMDRRLLVGLSRPDTAPKAADTYRQQSILTGGPADTVRLTLDAALREALLLMGSGGDLDRLRKFLSLVRQGCRVEPGPGRDLSSLAGHMLVRISRDEPGAVSESLGLLAHLVGSFREWRGEVSRGMLPTWVMR